MKKTAYSVFLRAAIIIALLLTVLLCGCSLKSPDIYEIKDYKITSVTAACGDIKLESISAVIEPDDTQKQVFETTIEYTYSKISDDQANKYFSRLKKEGFHEFKKYCWQTNPDKSGKFVQVMRSGNSIYVSAGTAVLG